MNLNLPIQISSLFKYEIENTSVFQLDLRWDYDLVCRHCQYKGAEDSRILQITQGGRKIPGTGSS